MDLACFKSRSGTHESSSVKYPYHRIRKEWENGVLRWHMIFSISYSSSLLIRSGGGAGKFRRFRDKVTREMHGRPDGSSRFLEGGIGK